MGHFTKPSKDGPESNIRAVVLSAVGPIIGAVGAHLKGAWLTFAAHFKTRRLIEGRERRKICTGSRGDKKEGRFARRRRRRVSINV